jgi:hypothetical protein
MIQVNAQKYLLAGLGLLAWFAVAGCSQGSSDLSAQRSGDVGVLATTTLLADQADLVTVAGEKINDQVMDLHFSQWGRGVAYTVKFEDGRTAVVHNGVAGNKYEEILYVRQSRDGKKVAYSARKGSKWSVIVDGREGHYFDDVGSAEFSPDGKHLLYDAKLGDQWHLVVDGKISKDTSSSFYSKFFSKDSLQTVTLENTLPDNALARVVIRDLQHNRIAELALQGSAVKYSRDKSRCALQNDFNGKKRVLLVDLTKPAVIGEGRLYDDISRMAFGSDGTSLAYVAVKDGKQYLVENDREVMLKGVSPTLEAPVPRPGGKGSAIAVTSTDGAFILFTPHAASQQRHYEEAAFPVFDAAGSSYAYCARNGREMFFVVNGHASPAYDMVMAAEFSPDGTRVVARVRKDGKRFVVVMDLQAKVISQHAPYETIFTPTFTADGKSVAYGVQDGSKLIWKVEKL